MALIEFDFKSETLGLASSLYAIVNQRSKSELGVDHRSPVLYLLHGLSDDHSGWLRKSSIERYALEYDVIVVMPDAHRSFYTNTRSGQRYFDFMTDELPRLCESYLPIASGRENTFVAGLSMGGYGAFKLALSHPDRYAAAASLSGALDLSSLSDLRGEMLPEWESIFGPEETYRDSENDVLRLARQATKSGAALPRLFQCCGTEDYLYPSNQSFLEHSRSLGLPVDYEEEAGEHEWGYWDRKVRRVLEWLPLLRFQDEKPAPASNLESSA